MRVYCRETAHHGRWKGLINDPDLDGSFPHQPTACAWPRELLMEINAMACRQAASTST